MPKGPRCSDQELRDETLMDRYVHGDTAAFDELFRRYERQAFAFFIRRTRSADRSEDLYQELFLRIHRARHTYDARRAFAPWFFQIAHHLLIDDVRTTGATLRAAGAAIASAGGRSRCHVLAATPRS